MGLRKATEPSGLRRVEPREYTRDAAGLLEQLQDDDASTRRWAARDLQAFPESVPGLCQHLLKEREPSVREVIFTTLQCLGGDMVVEAMVPLLRSEDANLRNSAIELLSRLPDQVGAHIDKLLRDNDPDVRIFTVNLLAELRHPKVASWLVQVLKEDDHINVVAAALEAIAEAGSTQARAAIELARQRFADDAFIGFAADMAEQRIDAS